MFDPVVPMASPVTKTYSKRMGSTEHDQKMDIAFDLLVSSPEERSLDESASTQGNTKHGVQLNGSTENSTVSTPTRKQRGSGLRDENRSPNLPLSSSDTSPALRKTRVS